MDQTEQGRPGNESITPTDATVPEASSDDITEAEGDSVAPEDEVLIDREVGIEDKGATGE